MKYEIYHAVKSSRIVVMRNHKFLYYVQHDTVFTRNLEDISLKYNEFRAFPQLLQNIRRGSFKLIAEVDNLDNLKNEYPELFI